MAAIFAQHHCDTRASRPTLCRLAQRLARDPQTHSRRSGAVFQNAAAGRESSSRGTAAELLRDLEMVAAIVNRAHRRLAGAEAAELDRQQREAARQQIAAH